MAESRKFNVKNRSASVVVYKIPEMNIRRSYNPGEIKVITFEELERLSYIDGGRELMANFLQIQDAKATKDLNIHTEPEYNMSEQDVIKMIQRGSLDEFLDMLDFAPIGVIDLVKDWAVKLPMNSVEKRQALKDKTGFDVTVAIQHLMEQQAEENAPATTDVPKRRVVKEVTEPGRRTSTPTYTRVAKEEVTEE